MPHKPPKKKAATKRKKKRNTDAVMPFNENKSVEVEKVNNGFVVSQFGPNGRKRFIETSKKAANDRALKLLG